MTTPSAPRNCRPSLSRVLVIAPTPFFSDRGCHVRIYEEVRALAQLGIESLIVTYPSGLTPDRMRVVRVRRLPGLAPPALGPGWSRPLLDGLVLAEAWRAAREFQPDVVHAHLHEGIFIGLFLRRRLAAPLVGDLQGGLTAELIDHAFLRRQSLVARAMGRLERWLIRQPDRLLASSTPAARALVQQGADPRRVASLPDGVDLDRFRPAPPDETLLARLGLRDRQVVVFLGVLTAYQGVDLLLEAVPLVARAIPTVHFLVMGYPNETHYRKLVGSRGLDHLVTLPGRIPYGEAARWLTLGTLAVSAKTAETEANGKLLNYMACGLPVIAADTPVSRELLGEAGVYAKPGDAEDLAARMIELLRDEARRRHLGLALRRRAEERFAWPVLIRQLVRTYEEARTAPQP